MQLLQTINIKYNFYYDPYKGWLVGIITAIILTRYGILFPRCSQMATDLLENFQTKNLYF